MDPDNIKGGTWSYRHKENLGRITINNLVRNVYMELPIQLAIV